MVFGFLKRFLWFFDITREFKGIKPAQTAAAGMISNSKRLIYKLIALKGLEKQLEKQINDYKEKTKEFKKMRTPEPGAERLEARKHERKYHGRRKQLLSLINLISETLKSLSKEFNDSIDNLKSITFDSNIIIFELEYDLNRFISAYHKIAGKLRKENRSTAGIKGFADKINTIKSDLKSELRVLWEASKYGERGGLSKYTVEEWSLRGDVPILRKMKVSSIEIGNLILRTSNLDPLNIESITENSKKLIHDCVLVQKDTKILLNRLHHLLSRTKNNLNNLDKAIRKDFLRILRKPEKKYASSTKEMTAQSRRLFLDIRIKPVYIKEVKLKIRTAA